MADRTYPPPPEPLSVPVYDNHTHLDPAVHRDEPGLEQLDWREQLDRAAAAGVKGVVQVGVDVPTSEWGAEHALLDPRMLAAVALHPNEAPLLEASGALDDALATIAALAARPRVRAIGETGLDYALTGPEGHAAQQRSFEAHIEIAKQNGLALQMHDRDAHAEIVATLERVGAPERTVFHCFSGDAALAALVVERGWYVSFAGTVTFKNAPALRQALEVVPRSRILIETDAPYLTPMPVRGRANAPYLLPHTLRFIAAHLEADPAHLAAQIMSNTEQVYGRWDSELDALGATRLPDVPDGALA